MKIYLDFDETITNSIRAVLSVLNPKYNTTYSPEEVKLLDFGDVFPNVKTDEIESCFESDIFWKNLTFKENAQEVIEKLLNRNYELTIVTKGTFNNLIKKVCWINKYFDNRINIVTLKPNESKGNIDMSDGILIDDNQFYLKESNAKYKILFENYKNCEWNNAWDSYIVHNWLEVAAAIEVLNEWEGRK